MLAFFNDIVELRLLPHRLNKDEVSLHRDKVLAWVHLVAFFASGILSIAMYYIEPSQVAPMLFSNLSTIALTFFFRKFGNHEISGNLLVTLLFAVLMQGMMSTGGLFSDNVLWMLLVPVTAFLFTKRKWGWVWSLVVVVVVVGLYFIEVNAEVGYRNLSLDLGPEYFLVSYIGLIGMLVGIVTIFVSGNESLLKSIKLTSAKLQARTDELESKNTLLKQQEAALKRSNQDLELLAYVASHDLKEPLRMINVYAKMLNKSLGESISERDQEFLKYITEGGVRMQNMLEDLLAYAKLGKEHKSEGKVDLERTMLLVQNNLKLRFQESSGSLNWNDLATLRGSSTHFIQLFQNLIANSLKFSREGVAPVIEVSGQQRGGQYVILLADNGIGIPEEDIDKIFGVFQRLGNSSKFEGSGIGLATVDRIMEGLGGSIKVESEYGLGTTFILSFPLERVISPSKKLTGITFQNS